jgi:RNA polymerase sigma-70 factor, ECF subfamily
LQTDADILLYQQLVSGSKVAFDTLFRKYYQALCRFAFLFNGNKDEAEDAVQTAFIALWEAKSAITITRSLKAYLYQMVRNNALMQIRKSNTRLQYEQQYVETQEAMIPDDKSFTDEEINNMVMKGMALLPDKCRTIFSLSRYDGLTYDEIAEYLEISPKTVENQMGIAFQKLREFLLPVWEKMLIIFGGILFLEHLITKLR